MTSWIICQIGARENFSVARSLERKGALMRLLTDLWCPPGLPGRAFLGRVGERHHPELSRRGAVWAPSGQALLREASDRVARRTGWSAIMNRNAWFQRCCVAHLRNLHPKGPVTVFAYSYAAHDILAHARNRGWRTVLGQIDPGPVEARMVQDLYHMAGQAHVHQPIPETYWENWQRETQLADSIVVNSSWSRAGLVAEGIPERKITVLPLAYESQATKPRPHRHPTADAPLRLLFLGQVTLRKGIDIALDALRLQPDLPVRLDIVGPVQTAMPDWVARDPRIRVHGAVPRSRVAEFYADADLFLFPTRSDGFGLTQLEALDAGVPVLASRHCGAVVQDGYNGLVLDPLDAATLTDILRDLVDKPDRLHHLKARTGVGETYGIAALGARLMALDDRLHGKRGTVT